MMYLCPPRTHHIPTTYIRFHPSTLPSNLIVPAALSNTQQDVHWWTQLGNNRWCVTGMPCRTVYPLTPTDGLKAYMSKYGEIDACTIMRDPSGRSRGFAFLTYTDPASVTKVMGEIHHLDGKQVSGLDIIVGV